MGSSSSSTLGLAAQRQQELQPAALAARQQADRRPLGVGVEPEPLQEPGVLPVGRPCRAGHGVARPASSGRGRARAGRSSRAARWCPSRRVPSAGASRPAMTSSSVDLPAPLGPTMPSRSRGSRARSTPRNSHGPSPNRWPTPCELDHLVAQARRAEGRGRARPAGRRASGRPSTIAVAASMRAFGLRVRAGAPRRSQASSARARLRRTVSAAPPAPRARPAPPGRRRSRPRGRSRGPGRARGCGS